MLLPYPGSFVFESAYFGCFLDRFVEFGWEFWRKLLFLRI